MRKRGRWSHLIDHGVQVYARARPQPNRLLSGEAPVQRPVLGEGSAGRQSTGDTDKLARAQLWSPTRIHPAAAWRAPSAEGRRIRRRKVDACVLRLSSSVSYQLSME